MKVNGKDDNPYIMEHKKMKPPASIITKAHSSAICIGGYHQACKWHTLDLDGLLDSCFHPFNLHILYSFKRRHAPGWNTTFQNDSDGFFFSDGSLKIPEESSHSYGKFHLPSYSIWKETAIPSPLGGRASREIYRRQPFGMLLCGCWWCCKALWCPNFTASPVSEALQ